MEAAMKRMLTAFESLFIYFGTATLALAEEKPAGGGYEATAYVWFALIGFIILWGVYDSFFRPMD